MKTKTSLKTLLSFGVMFALAITAHAQNLYVSVNGPLGSGNSDGSISEYSSTGMQITFTSGIPRPRGVAFDANGTPYAGVSDLHDHYTGKAVTFNAKRKPTPVGAATFYFCEGIATDTAGNVYVMAQGEEGTIFKFVPGVSRSVFGSVPIQGFDLAFDSAGNLYATDSGEATIYKFAPDGTRTVFAGPDAFPEGSAPVGLAFDSGGNLFVSTEGDPGNDGILVFAPDSSESTFATGLTQPRGLAFDAAGNLFVAETLAAPNGTILKFPTGGGMVVFASGLDRPEFLAFGPPQ
jgi:secreted PhoX family phosphatase